MTKLEFIQLTDNEAVRVQAYANQFGVTFEEAATQLTKDAIASKFRRHLNRGPARLYDMPARAGK